MADNPANKRFFSRSFQKIGEEMNQFYTLSTKERQDVLDEIHSLNHLKRKDRLSK